MKQISKNIIEYIFHSCSKSAISLQPGRFGWSDRLGCCWRRSIFLCLPLHPTQWGFQLIHRLSLNRQMFLEKRGVYAWSEHCVHVQLWFFPVELYILKLGHLISTGLQVLSPHWRVLLLSFQMFFVGWEQFELALDDCSKSLVFETTANARQLGVFLVSWLLHFGWDHLLK